ncbi:augmin complex subunit dgt5 [Contarinia nasturtii]|uniref:augmin complex subunit dgt5 n=1 Tax=Contarinia nasturtii TaxID=265458 RepID=UPI0012D3E006|nr:augmin complex subunit dgt5 [Contarinia nasturtii]
MGVEDDILHFEDWADNLGFPSNVLPPKKTLSRIFSSGQMLAFNELMRRIQPQQDVKAVRDEIKVRKVERIGGNTVAVKKVQSEQLYLYQTKKKLEERLENLKSRVAAKKQQYQKLAISSKENNIQTFQLKEEIVDTTAKNAICKLKTREIERQIEAEKEIGKNIDEITPVKFTNSNDKNAMAALTAAKLELQKFYATFNHTENYEVNLTTRQQLWQRLRGIFAQIPNLTLWTGIGDQMKQKASMMETLSLMDMEKILYVNAGYDDPTQKNNLQVEIGKLHAKHVKLCIMRHGIDKRSEGILNDYVVFYESFLNDLRSKYLMYNNQSIDDDFLGDYLSLYSTLYYGKGEIEYLLNVVEENQTEIQRRKKSNDDYLVGNTELTKIYLDMENLYVRTHEDIYNLTHVREKIQHSEDLMRYLLQCKKDQQLPAPGSDTRMNSSGNSSVASNDSVLSTNRSDSANSTALFGRSEIGAPRSMPTTSLPNQLSEIKIFLNTPIVKFKLRNPLQEHLDLCANPLLNIKIYDQLPNDIKRLIFDYMITPAMSVKNLQSQIEWFSQMKIIEKAFEAPEGLPEVDESKLCTQKNQQNDALSEITDEASAICANIHRIYRNIERYINFINENPLRKWIPATETFNGKTYHEYEREFMMYYKMVQKSDPI